MPQFTEEFERDVLTSIFRHPEVFEDYQEVIEPRVFGLPAYRKLWHLLQEFYREHKELPTPTTLVDIISDKEKEGFFLSEDLKCLLDNIDPILNGTPVNEKYVLNKLISWVKEKRLRSKVTKAVRQITKGEAGVDEVLSLIKEAEIPKEVLRKQEEEDFVSQMVDHVLMKQSQPNANIIPTGMSTLDICLGGGPKRGQKCILMGPPGGGKTTGAVQICGHAMQQGLGAYYCFNDDTKMEMNDRFISYFSYIPTPELADEGNLAEIESVQKKLAKSRGELGLCQLPEMATPSYVRRAVEKRIESGHDVDVLVVDHIGNMVADQANDGNWLDIKMIFKGLASIALEHDLILYVIMHTKRKAEGRAYMHNGLIGLSYEPVKDANLILAIWRMKEDKSPDAPSLRMQVTKHRNGPGEGAVIKFGVSFDTMRINEYGTIISDGEEGEEEIYDPTI